MPLRRRRRTIAHFNHLISGDKYGDYGGAI